MKKIQHYIEYYVLSSFSFISRLFPLEWNRLFARRLADFVFLFIPIRKRVVIENLTLAFGKTKTRSEISYIARKTYQQFAQTMIELIYFPKLDRSDLEHLVHIENKSLLDTTFKLGKGAIFVGAHFCNWELMAAVLAIHYPLTLVIGQQKNHLVDDLLNSFRLQKGTKLVPLKMALRGVLRALKNKEFVAIVSDQDAHEDGVFVDFFGKPASTPKGPAMFALRANCPLVMGFIYREGKRFRMVFEIIPRPQLCSDENINIQNYTASYTKLLEENCRKYPDHWFWMHKRWKTTKPSS